MRAILIAAVLLVTCSTCFGQVMPNGDIWSAGRLVYRHQKTQAEIDADRRYSERTREFFERMRAEAERREEIRQIARDEARRIARRGW